MLPFRKPNREAYANFLRAKYEAYTGASTVRSFPFYLVVEPSDVCQLRCTTCPTGMENESRHSGGSMLPHRRNRAVMKPELFDSVIDELGPYLFLVLFYNWGEPLLNKSLADLVRKSKDHAIETEVHTNLSLPLSEQRIDELLSAGLDSLNASIDGFSQEAYEIHRVGGRIDLIHRNLEAFAKARTRLGVDTRIAYKMLIFRHNEHEIAAAQKYCRDIGIEFIRDDAGIQDPDWLPSYRRNEAPYYTQDEVREMIARSAAAGEPVDPDAGPPGTFWAPNKKEDEVKLPDFCSWHYGVSVLTAGGPVSPCCATPDERHDFGVVVPGQSRFSDVWNNEKFRHARSVLANTDPGDTRDVETPCDPCDFPKLVQHVYSVHDLKVVAGFHRLFNGSEPALEAGFRFLARTRYGGVPSALLRRGIFHPLLMLLVGRGDEREMNAFVQFYRDHLLDEPGASDADRKPAAAV